MRPPPSAVDPGRLRDDAAEAERLLEQAQRLRARLQHTSEGALDAVRQALLAAQEQVAACTELIALMERSTALTLEVAERSQAVSTDDRDALSRLLARLRSPAGADATPA